MHIRSNRNTTPIRPRKGTYQAPEFSASLSAPMKDFRATAAKILPERVPTETHMTCHEYISLGVAMKLGGQDPEGAMATPDTVCEGSERTGLTSPGRGVS